MLARLHDFDGALALRLPQPDSPTLRRDGRALRRAYHKAVLFLHPDKHVESPAAAQSLALALFQTCAAAYAAQVTAPARSDGLAC